MVLNAYNYPEKCFTKVDLNNSFYKTEFQKVCPLNRGKNREKLHLSAKRNHKEKIL